MKLLQHLTLIGTLLLISCANNKDGELSTNSKKIYVSVIILIFMLVGCKTTNDEKTEKIQKHRGEILDVSDKIIDINPEILFGNSVLYIIDDILIVNEVSPKGEKGIHLFNKNNFKYITSTGILGRGPGEIASLGGIGIDKSNRILWVQDHGNKVMWKFPLDSVLNNEMFKPNIKLELNYESFIESFGFLNDSIVLGVAVQILPDYSFVKAMSILNLNTNIIEKYGYTHPIAVGKNSSSEFALSVENNFYVNCYNYNDLITINDVKGNLKFNVYGPEGLNNKDNKKSYFFGVDIIGKDIIASYIGDVGLIADENGPKGNTPSKLIVFDMKGNYKKTIETGYKFTYFCVDEENKRIIAYFNSRIVALGYFNVDFESR